MRTSPHQHTSLIPGIKIHLVLMICPFLYRFKQAKQHKPKYRPTISENPKFPAKADCHFDREDNSEKILALQ
jgi:hypothetical protein